MSRALKSLPLYLAFLLIIVFLFTLKTNYFVDELWSYGLANNNDSHIMRWSKAGRPTKTRKNRS